ncbi:hypothetical protein [Nocardiopsis sp. SBT366]|uniref:hypothetical protein n=1 Tax=Nocardiopsis sp. SBT366 TaxID=1580529 RepID=UPI00066C7176|nr:hypothetical protein [Nocardiopsis sp. SBT366]
MRAFTRITTAAVLAGGMTFAGVGAAQADPKDEVAQPVGEVAQPAEEATGSAENLSPEAEALLANPQVQEILANEEAVALLGDADSLKSLQALMELEDPTAALAALELPVAAENLPVSAEEAPVATDEVTGQLPAEAPATGDVAQPVEDAVGGVGLR